MPRLAICSRDLHWHWINRTLLCDTMEVSMLSGAWLTIAQHVFQPALTGRPELISRKIVSGETGNKGYRGEQISRKIVSRELGPRCYRDFAKNITLLGAKKMGSNMRPRYIQFRDIHDRDISGLHCNHVSNQENQAKFILGEVKEREILSLSAFLRTEDIGVHIVHISRLTVTYTLE